MGNAAYSEYAARNSEPILEVLRREFSDRASILEIGSGTGQHGVAFAEALVHLNWQTSDVDANCAAIHARVKEAGLPNLSPPLRLNVLTDDVQASAFDGAYSANTAHIMSIDAVRRMFELLGKALVADGVFCLYGPFRQDGDFNTESNANFDHSLRTSDPSMGIRDIEVLDEFANCNDMTRHRLYAMPANNHCAIWRRGNL